MNMRFQVGLTIPSKCTVSKIYMYAKVFFKGLP